MASPLHPYAKLNIKEAQRIINVSSLSLYKIFIRDAMLKKSQNFTIFVE